MRSCTGTHSSAIKKPYHCNRHQTSQFMRCHPSLSKGRRLGNSSAVIETSLLDCHSTEDTIMSWVLGVHYSLMSILAVALATITMDF